MPGSPAVACDKSVVLVVFAITYLGIAMGRVPGLKLDRTGIALLGAIAMMVFGGLTIPEVNGFINWPTILLLFGFFVLAAQLRLSGFFDAVAVVVSRRLGHPGRFLLLLMVSTAALSAFLNNDIVCVAFAPVVTQSLLKRQLNPVPFLIALALSSNIGAAATLVGNAQDMMIGQMGGLDFGSYALWCLAPVLFALVSAYSIVWLLSRKHLQLAPDTVAAGAAAPTAYPFDRAHTLKGLAVLVVVIGLFFTDLPKELVALTAAGFHLASRKYPTENILALVNWPVLVLFMSLFAVTGAFQITGYGEQAVHWLTGFGVSLRSPSTLALATAALSNLINNSATVMLLLKVAPISEPTSGYVLALANSFGGNLLIIGSVANIIVAQQAREMGVNISFREFARLGVPVTLTSLAGLLVWIAVMT